jgi:hypothetical protein
MNEARKTPESKDRPDRQDRAKYGAERRGGDADWATAAQRENNTAVVPELLDGRCSIDGLPEGSCSHFPGPQQVTGPDGYTYDSADVSTDETGNMVVREGARSERHRQDREARGERYASQPGGASGERYGDYSAHGRPEQSAAAKDKAGVHLKKDNDDN